MLFDTLIAANVLNPEEEDQAYSIYYYSFKLKLGQSSFLISQFALDFSF